jgi:hypothetical protein
LWELADKYPLKMAWRRYQKNAAIQGWPPKSYQAIAQKMERSIKEGRHSQGYAQDWWPILQFAEWCGINPWRFDRMVKKLEFPIRKHSTKNNAQRFVRKKDLEEWLWWNKNITLFLAYNPKIEGIRHCLRADLFTRLERSEKQFDRTRPHKRPVVNAATGERFASTTEAAKASYTGRVTIQKAATEGRVTRAGDRWVWADEYDRVDLGGRVTT